MITDMFTKLSDGQALTGAASIVSSNIWNVASGGATKLRDLGKGTPVTMRMVVTEAFVSGGLSKLVPVIALSSTSDLATLPLYFPWPCGNDAADPGGGIPKSFLSLGAEFCFTLPPIPAVLLAGPPVTIGRQFLGCVFLITVANFSAGKVTLDGGQRVDRVPPRHAPAYQGP